MTVTLVSRWDKTKVLYTAETAADVREAVVAAVKSGADLSGADLSGADLSGADLSGADLSGADLRGAYLRGADLSGADLSGADLRGADLRGAYLSGADLRGAYLSGADLRGAYLSGAYLRGAYLSGADLSGAYLSGAYLRGADLRGAYLRGALDPVKTDIWNILDLLPAEVPALEQALLDGKIDGSVYSSGDCACLVGTLAIARGWDGEGDINAFEDLNGVDPDGGRPAEQWFARIQPGDIPTDEALKPHIDPGEGWVSKEEWDKLVAAAGEFKHFEGVYRASQALEWVREWRKSREQLVAGLVAAGFGQAAEGAVE